jgi:hypothetical protein
MRSQPHLMRMVEQSDDLGQRRLADLASMVEQRSLMSGVTTLRSKRTNRTDPF